MRTFSHTNFFHSHIAFHVLREDKLKHVHSKLPEAIAQMVRWAVVGILALVIALPAIISLSSSM